MSDSLVIRRFQEGDDEKVNELLATAFSTWKGSAYWRWKYRENPAGFYANIWLAEDKGKIVSYYAIIPVKLKVNDEIILGAQSLDSATHPDYRRRGLFVTLGDKTLTEAVKDGIHISYGFPGRTAYGGDMKTGWIDLGSVPRCYRLLKVRDALKIGTAWGSLVKLRPRSLYNTVKLSWKALRKQNLTDEETSQLRFIRYILLLLAVLISNPRCLFRPGKARQVPGLDIKGVDSFDERITPFWREISHSFPIAIDRTREYLNWKYKSNPASKFVIFIAEKEAQIEGYMVLKSERDEGIIMDIMSRDNQVFACLLHKALQHFKDENKSIVECWMLKNFGYSKILRKFGFGSYQWVAGWLSHLEFFGGMINPFLIYLNSPDAKQEPQKFQRLDSWFIAAGDSDWEEMSQFSQSEEP